MIHQAHTGDYLDLSQIIHVSPFKLAKGITCPYTITIVADVHYKNSTYPVELTKIFTMGNVDADKATDEYNKIIELENENLKSLIKAWKRCPNRLK